MVFDASPSTLRVTCVTSRVVEPKSAVNASNQAPDVVDDLLRGISQRRADCAQRRADRAPLVGGPSSAPGIGSTGSGPTRSRIGGRPRRSNPGSQGLRRS